jgi:DNA-binding MarR family transcriptional regulator
MDLDKSFLKIQEMKKTSYGRLVSLQKRFFDEWALEKLGSIGYTDFKIGYFAILMNIGLDGVTNNELAEKICVTKQASSKVIKDLEAYGLVTSVLHDKDSRSVLIKLTKKGKEFVIKATEQIYKRTAEYEKLVGKARFKQAMETMYIIMNHEMSQWVEKNSGKK